MVKKAGKDLKKVYSTSEIDAMEELALSKSNKAVSAIENALAVWELSEEKPDDLKPKIDRLRYFHEALTTWEKKMLKGAAKKESMEERVERLREFAEICYRYT